MKRQLILTLAVAAITITAKGQVAKWLIPPLYDNIYMTNGENLIITDSLNQKTIWSQTGLRLATTNDHIFSFVEGFAVTTKRGSEMITGFYDSKGKFTKLSRCNVSYSKPYFSNNYLLVRNDSYYRFINSNGELMSGQYAKAYPFSNGYASCNTFANLEKKKDPYNLLITKEHEQVPFRFGSKQFDDDDLEFISSVNDENIGIVVAKHRLYYFNGKDRTLSPIFARKDESNIKNQAKLEDEFCLSNESDSVSILSAKCGKNDRIRIRFNSMLIPISISLADGDYTYSTDVKAKRSFESPLRMSKEGNKYGVSWGGIEILPPQLDELITCFNDKSFVRLNGKCGMLQVFKDEEFKININKGNTYSFGFT